MLNYDSYDDIKCVYSNVQSIFNKKKEIELYIGDQNVDMMFFTETFIHEDHSPSEYSFENYQKFVFYKNRGGACIYAKNNIPCYQVFPPNMCSDSVWIVIRTQDGIKRLYGCVYLSPNSSTENQNLLLDNIQWAKNNFSESVIVGDFNAPDISWSTQIATSEFGKNLVDRIDSCGYEQLVAEPTRFRSNQNPSLLDLIFSTDPECIQDLVVSHPFGKSDHCRLEFCIKNKMEKKKPITHKFNFKKIDETKFVSEINKIDIQVLNNRELNESYEYFLKKVNDAIEISVPKFTQRAKLYPPWSNRTLGKLAKVKRRKWDRFKFSRSNVDYEAYKVALRNFNAEKNIAVLNFEKNIIASKKTDPKKYYNYVSRKSKYNNQKIILKSQNVIETNESKCADILNNYFSSVYTCGASNLDVDASKIPIFPKIPDAQITTDLVEKVISDLDVNKSSGPDGVPAFLIKKFANAFCPLLSILFQRSFNEGVVPNSMKTAIVIPLHKSGDKTDPSNYRPVSLTPIIAKMLEKIIKSFLEAHVHNFSILSEFQHGFRQNFSTSSNLIEFTNNLVNIANQSKSISIVYTDLKKAFDSVPHDLLMVKLRRYGVCGKMERWLTNFLSNRNQRVRIENHLSELKPVLSGVPQGGVLSGLLFSLYINDLPHHIENSKISLYADDAKIYSEINSHNSIVLMQEDINRMAKWCRDWRLAVNPTKCFHVQYNPRSVNRAFNPTYTIENTIITRKEQVRDLGIRISDDLKFHTQVQSSCKKAHSEINRIRRSFLSRSPDFIGNMYKLFVRPHMEYCVEVWNPQMQGDINMMERVQNKMSRLIPNGRNLSHAERNRLIGVTSHQVRRLRGDLINIYKKHDDVNLFSLRNNERSLRGHNKTLAIPIINNNIKKHSFSVRAINYWNSLPSEIVNSSSLNVFKGNIDKFLEDHGGQPT